MKKKYLILLASAIPCVFLGMYGDAAWHTMALYFPAVLVFSLLCFFAVKTRSAGLLLLGNGLSALTSGVLTALCSLEAWSWYFKPLSPLGFFAAASVAALLVQLVILAVCLGRRPQEKTKVQA